MTNEEFIESIRLEGEEWRDVVGYKGYYMVSSLGRVISLSRETPREFVSSLGNPTTRIPHKDMYPSKGKLLTLQQRGLGSVKKEDNYFTVGLYKKSKRKIFPVHRLVAFAFLPTIDRKHFVDHIDGNRTNNNVSNLRWVNKSENAMNPATHHKISKWQIGKTTWNAKPVAQIKNGLLIKVYRSASDAALQNDFSSGNINECCRGVRKQHKGYKWMYLSDYESLVSMSKNSTDSSAD